MSQTAEGWSKSSGFEPQISRRGYGATEGELGWETEGREAQAEVTESDPPGWASGSIALPTRPAVSNHDKRGWTRAGPGFVVFVNFLVNPRSYLPVPAVFCSSVRRGFRENRFRG